jgi:tetratricopeptide (TPR) repeat protein
MSHERGKRLDTWKAIASHLGKSDRTVQRWHLLYKLPVHRVGSRSGIIAYSDEIDEWLRNAERTIAEELPNRGTGALIEMPSKKAESGSGELISKDSAKLPGVSRASVRIDTGYQMWRMLSRDNLQNIARKFREAIDLDPLNPEAHAGLSHALIAQGMIGGLTLSSAYSAARSAIQTALDLNPGSAEAKCALAWLKMALDRDWDGAREIFDDLLNQNPVNTRVMDGRALLHIAYGVLQPASELLYAASEYAPLSSISLGLHCWSEYLMGNYSEVKEHIAQAHASGRSGPILTVVDALTSVRADSSSTSISYIECLLDEDPANESAQGVLGYVAGRSGDTAKARAILEALMIGRTHARDKPYYALALTHLGLDQHQEAIQSIISSYKEGSLWSLGFHLDPALLPLKQEHEFMNFIDAAYPIAT